ncbi:MAG: hypothetical protein LBU98_00545, partial [Alistipes sp.]|nr:hypothetical protein [Alistipes sp.]
MKKLMTAAMLAVFALGATTFAACEKGGGDPEPTAPVITIGTQPTAPAALTEGAIMGSLTVTATVTEGATLAYQWYSNTAAGTTGGTKIDGATAASYTLPATLTAGTYYYFCEVGAQGAKAVRTNAVTVTVAAAPEPQIEVPDESELTQQAFADEQTSGGFTFVAKAAWTATVTESANTRAEGISWLRLLLDGEETYSGAAGTFNLVIELDTNYTGDDRSATITITSGGTNITITVTQEGTTESGDTPEPKPSLSELVAHCEELHEWVDAAWLQIDNNYSVYTARLSLTQATPELYDFWTKSYEWIA